MKALVVAEGKHELGGALSTIVQRLTSKLSEIHFDRVGSPNVHAHHGKGQGYFKRAVRWMLVAKERGFDVLILVIDHDRYPERLHEIRDAQEYVEVKIARALGVAIQTFDAWMLADESALTEVLGYNIDRQQAPEKLSNPKAMCEKLLSQSNCHDNLTSMYSALAEKVNFQILESRCSTGFGQFAQRVRTI